MERTQKELTIDILLEELNNWEPKYPLELIHIGQRQMAMILDYITTLQRENKHLNLQLDQALKDYDELQKENERLNNIINELEQWLKEHSIIDYSCSDVILHEQMALNVAFNYLQILKENKQ